MSNCHSSLARLAWNRTAALGRVMRAWSYPAWRMKRSSVGRLMSPLGAFTSPSGVSTPSFSKNSIARRVETRWPFLFEVLTFSAATISA